MKMNKRVYTAAFEQNLKRPAAMPGQALQDLTTIRRFLTGNALFAFFDAPWFPVYLVVIFLVQPRLGCVCPVRYLGADCAGLCERDRLKKAAGASRWHIAAGNLATNNLRNAEVIEAMGVLPNLMNRWFKLHARFCNCRLRPARSPGIITACTKFVTYPCSP